MVTALFVLVLLLTLVVGLQQWLIHDLSRDLNESMRDHERTLAVAESLLNVLKARGLLNTVDTCQRTQGSKR